MDTGGGPTYMPGTVLRAGNTEVNNSQSYSLGTHRCVGETDKDRSLCNAGDVLTYLNIYHMLHNGFLEFIYLFFGCAACHVGS